MELSGLEQAVVEALSGVPHPGSGRDIVTNGNVQSLSVTDDGAVSFAFVLGSGDSGSLVKDARSAVEAVEGVTKVKVNVQLPQTGDAAPDGAGQHGTVPEPTPAPQLLSGVGHVVAVSSGKGGVGKSMVAANLAAALGAMGKRVGLLDADVYGPNIPTMFGEESKPRVLMVDGVEMVEPPVAHGVRLMSLGLLMDKEQPAIMRGPLISGILKQFLQQVAWGPLDVMIVDMPPGTGDAQLSLVQTIDIDGAVMVTTPQDISTGDVRRGVRMFERVNTRVLGVVENMSGMTCPHCGERVEVFGAGGGQRMADEMGLSVLGTVPLDPAVAVAGDSGSPTVISNPDSPAGEALRAVAQEVAKAIEMEL